MHFLCIRVLISGYCGAPGAVRCPSYPATLVIIPAENFLESLITLKKPSLFVRQSISCKNNKKGMVRLVFEYTADKKVGQNVFCSPGGHHIYDIHPQQYFRERTMCGQVKNSLIYSFMKLINVTVNYADILIVFFVSLRFFKYFLISTYRRSCSQFLVQVCVLNYLQYGSHYP